MSRMWNHVQAGDNCGARELAVKDEELNPSAYQRNGTHQAVGKPETGAGQQVIGQRVAGEALDHGQHEQAQADQPVDLTRLTESACEEDAQHVHGGRCYEENGGPVMDLTN